MCTHTSSYIINTLPFSCSYIQLTWMGPIWGEEKKKERNSAAHIYSRCNQSLLCANTTNAWECINSQTQQVYTCYVHIYIFSVLHQTCTKNHSSHAQNLLSFSGYRYPHLFVGPATNYMVRRKKADTDKRCDWCPVSFIPVLFQSSSVVRTSPLLHWFLFPVTQDPVAAAHAVNQLIRRVRDL